MFPDLQLIVGSAFALAAASAAAVSLVLIRVSTQEGQANEVLIMVLLVNNAILVPLAAILSYPRYGLGLISWLAFAGAGLSGTMLGRSFSYEAIKRIGASRSESIVASQPLHAALIAVLVLGETLTAGHLLGILAIMGGVAAISRELRKRPSRSLQQISKINFSLPLVAAFFYGIEPIFAKLGLAQGTPVLVGLAIKTVTASAVFLVYLAGRGTVPAAAHLGGAKLKWHLAAGFFNTLFLLSYYQALEVAPVILVVPIIQVTPLLVIVLSLLFLQRLESITWKLVAAASTVVMGAILVTWASR